MGGVEPKENAEAVPVGLEDCDPILNDPVDEGFNEESLFGNSALSVTLAADGVVVAELDIFLCLYCLSISSRCLS